VRRAGPRSGCFASSGSPALVSRTRCSTQPVGWVERSDTHRTRAVKRWVSLRSTHLTDCAASGARGADELMTAAKSSLGKRSSSREVMFSEGSTKLARLELTTTPYWGTKPRTVALSYLRRANRLSSVVQRMSREMTTIPLGTTGKIVAGTDLGRFVKIIDDSANTGGFLILTCDDQYLTNGFDNWVEDHNALVRYFRELNWQIEWLD
jgi:hypothetical protein